MSRIQDALKRAEESRTPRSTSGEGTPSRDAMNAEMLDEVRRMEASLASWRPIPGKPAASSVPPAAASESPVSSAARLNEEIRRCQGELNARESRVMQVQQQRQSLKAQSVEQERVVTQAAAHLDVLRQRLQQAEADGKRAESERVAQSERLATLRRCQELAAAAAQSEQELQSHAEAMARIAKVQQRIAQKLSQHQLKAQQLQRSSSELQRQINETLGTSTETPQ